MDYIVDDDRRFQERIHRLNYYYLRMHTPKADLFKLCCLFLLTMGSHSLVLFNRSPIFGAFQVRLSNGAVPLSPTSNKRFSTPNTYNYQNIQAIGLALSGYQMPSVSQMSYTADPSYSVETNTLFITLSNMNSSSFTLLTYTVIVITNAAKQILDIQNVCFAPSQTALALTSLNYIQRFNFTTNFNKTANDNIQIMPYLRSISNFLMTGFNTFNASGFTFSNSPSNMISFSINISTSVIQQFCLSTVLLHFTNLKKFDLYNASFFSPISINSSIVSQNLLSMSTTGFGINPVYGPLYNEKCVLGILNYRLSALGNHSLLYNLSEPLPGNTSFSGSHFLEMGAICFVKLQCQYLYQQYYVMINDCQNTCNLPNCTSCSTATSCSTCIPGYFVNGVMRCQPCLLNCLNCTTATSCLNCIPGYFFNLANSSCVPCAPNCLVCTASYCSNCIVGYFTNGPNCTSCNSFMSNCETCTSNRACTKCKYGNYFASSQAGCNPCSIMAFCQNCMSSNQCVACVKGYYLTSGFCRPCTFAVPECCLSIIPNCSKCSSNLTCSSCLTGYFFPLNSTDNTTCLPCNVLLTNCTECASNINCTKCQTGSFLSNSTCFSCGLAIPNCLACYGVDNCYICDGNYIVNQGQCTICGDATTTVYYYVQNNQCTLCSSGIENCLKCTSGSTCTQCNPGFFVNNASCVFCGTVIRNCILCLDLNTCLACSAGNYLKDVQCFSCLTSLPGCNTCILDQNMTTGSPRCLLCSQQTYMGSNGSCFNCSEMDRCEKCSDSRTCTRCAPGFYLASNTCLNCSGSNCVTCTSNISCSSCSSGYFLTSDLTCKTCSTMKNCLWCRNSTFCLNCKDGFYLGIDGVCYDCFKAIPNCITCLNATFCITCLTNYFLSNSSACIRCNTTLTNCLACAPNNTCQLCLNGYFLNPTTGICLSCSTAIPNCGSCTNITTCLECKTSFYLINITRNTSVVLVGYNTTNNCSSCLTITNCVACTNVTTCTACAYLYFPLDGRCALCVNYLQRCLSCNSSSYCTNCEYGFLVDMNGQCTACIPLLLNCQACLSVDTPNLCGNCSDGYYLTAESICASCKIAIPHCQNCLSGTLCLQCDNGYYAAVSNKQCLGCSPQCQTCTNYSSCSKCGDGYYLATSGSCSSCISNCRICNSSTYCLNCAGGYYLSAQYQCVSCSNINADCLVCSNGQNCTIFASSSTNTSTGINVWLYIALSAAGLLFLLIVIIVLCCLCKSCKKAKQDDKGSVVGVSQHDMVIVGSKGQKDFELEHDGMCKFCGVNPLEVMNIELLCLQCEKEAQDSVIVSKPIRKQIIFSKNNIDNADTH